MARRYTPRKHHDVSVCVGEDWYRYPSSFFLPNDVEILDADGDAAFLHFAVRFYRSSFHGSLPKPFQSAQYGSNCTCVPNRNMNDLNRETADQYVEDENKDCDFIFDTTAVDRLMPDESTSTLGWKLWDWKDTTDGQATEFVLLNVDRTPWWCRVGVIPWVVLFVGSQTEIEHTGGSPIRPFRGERRQSLLNHY